MLANIKSALISISCLLGINDWMRRECAMFKGARYFKGVCNEHDECLKHEERPILWNAVTPPETVLNGNWVKKMLHKS